MAQKTVQSATSKWLSGINSGLTNYTDGVNAVRTSPGQLAAAAADTWAANVAAAKSLFRSKSAAVSLQAWQADTIAKADRWASGASAGEGKFNAFMSAFLPKVYAAVAQLPPRGAFAQNKVRAAAMMDALHQMKGSF